MSMTKAPKNPGPTLVSSNDGKLVTPIKPKAAKVTSVKRSPDGLSLLVQQAADKPMPPVTFSPEALAKLLNELTAQRAELAEIKATMVEANKAKIDKAVKATAGTGKPTSADNEKAVVKAFAKAGFGKVTPHVDVKTFNRWKLENMRPMEGSKSQKVNGLRLFHKTQCRAMTKAEIKEAREQIAAANLRREGSPDLELQ
jgi:hypothetical protein